MEVCVYVCILVLTADSALDGLLDGPVQAYKAVFGTEVCLCVGLWVHYVCMRCG